MILMMVEGTKSYIWFGGPYEALNHPKSSSRNPRGPNWEAEAEEDEVEGERVILLCTSLTRSRARYVLQMGAGMAHDAQDAKR